jgi:hypothetical protein
VGILWGLDDVLAADLPANSIAPCPAQPSRSVSARLASSGSGNAPNADYDCLHLRLAGDYLASRMSNSVYRKRADEPAT